MQMKYIQFVLLKGGQRIVAVVGHHHLLLVHGEGLILLVGAYVGRQDAIGMDVLGRG